LWLRCSKGRGIREGEWKRKRGCRKGVGSKELASMVAKFD
jgi:hypothetical protein